jgi:hypothetical protein
VKSLKDNLPEWEVTETKKGEAKAEKPSFVISSLVLRREGRSKLRSRPRGRPEVKLRRRGE